MKYAPENTEKRILEVAFILQHQIVEYQLNGLGIRQNQAYSINCGYKRTVKILQLRISIFHWDALSVQNLTTFDKLTAKHVSAIGNPKKIQKFFQKKDTAKI